MLVLWLLLYLLSFRFKEELLLLNKKLVEIFLFVNEGDGDGDGDEDDDEEEDVEDNDVVLLVFVAFNLLSLCFIFNK